LEQKRSNKTNVSQRSKKYIKITKLIKGKPVVCHVLNIMHGRFLHPQQYVFNVAEAAEGDKSITVIRMIIPKGTKIMQGYNEILESLKKLGYEDPYDVCIKMGFTEVAEGAGFCGEATYPECYTCDQPDIEGDECCECPHFKAFNGRS
jgi:hypothetical protein